MLSEWERPPAPVGDPDADKRRGREDRREEGWHEQTEDPEHDERDQSHHSGAGSDNRRALPQRLAGLDSKIEDRTPEDQKGKPHVGMPERSRDDQLVANGDDDHRGDHAEE